jgi:hypothetical protein
MVNRIFKPRLSKEHYLQVCRFLKIPKDEIDYEQYKKQDCYTQFRIWHKKLMDERDKK